MHSPKCTTTTTTTIPNRFEQFIVEHQLDRGAHLSSPSPDPQCPHKHVFRRRDLHTSPESGAPASERRRIRDSGDNALRNRYHGRVSASYLDSLNPDTHRPQRWMDADGSRGRAAAVCEPIARKNGS